MPKKPCYILFADKWLSTRMRGKMMSRLVRCAYNQNTYNNVYRHERTLTDFEGVVLKNYLAQLVPSPSILDIGCGSGVPYGQYLVENQCKLTGIDISQAQIEKAKKNLPASTTLICGDFLSTRLEPYYDGIVMLYSLYHIHRDQHHAVLSKLYELLDDEGVILMNIRTEDAAMKYKDHFCGKPMLWSHYAWPVFSEMLTMHGFVYDVIGDEKDHGSPESHLWIYITKQKSKSNSTGQCCL